MPIKFKMNLKNIVIAEIAVAALVLLIIRPMIFGPMKQAIIGQQGAADEIRRKLDEKSAASAPEEQELRQKNLEKNIEIHNRILASLEQIKEKLASTIVKDTDVPVVIEKLTKLTQGVTGVELVSIKPDIAQPGGGVMGFEGGFGASDSMGGTDGQNFEPNGRTEELNINIEVKSKYKDLIGYFEKLSDLPMAFYVKSLKIAQSLDEMASAGNLSQVQAAGEGFDALPGEGSYNRRPESQKMFESKPLSISIVLTTILTK